MENNTANWNFPDNNYTNVTGVNPTDTEIFKKEPTAYFAREICQNSIDAPMNGNSMPVRVEFKKFELHRDSVPGLSNLVNEVKACRKYIETGGKEEHIDIARRLEWSFGSEDDPYITCLRVSDFNTTGLYGVKTNQEGLPFFELTRRVGSSDKRGNSAGSKGIGKFASFVISNTRTVFYSTRAFNKDTNEVETGHIGLARLFARPLDDKGLFTHGTGYYAVDKYNLPLQNELHLDPSFKRKEDEYGTDVFIIGFRDEPKWQAEIMRKVLDSFMAAIIYGTLEVVVDSILINKDTVGKIIEKLREGPINKENRVIVSQYDLLRADGENIHKKTVQIDGCNVDLILKTYSTGDEKWASKQCVKIRYPYMKITYSTPPAMIPFSAMCLIGDNKLNTKLRSIENPQHTEWQKNRLREDGKLDQYKEISKILCDINTEINSFVAEELKSGNEDSTDFEGAGDYLPDTDMIPDGTDVADNSKPGLVDDKPIISTPSRRKVRGYSNAKEPGNDSESASTGEFDENGQLGSEDNRNTNPDLSPNPDPQPRDTPEHKYNGEGNKPYMKHLVSNGVRFHCVQPADNSRKYDIIFTANNDGDACELGLFAVGDSNDKEVVLIESATVNGNDCELKDSKIINLKITKGETYTVSCVINRDDLFASRVEIYAYR